MSTAAEVKVTIAGSRVGARARTPGEPDSPALAAFERIYVGHADVVMASFARRCAEPQTVADLTSETFVRAASGFAGFDPRRGSQRAWLFGIASHLYAGPWAEAANGGDGGARTAR